MPDIITIFDASSSVAQKADTGHMHCRIWQTIMIHIFTKLPPAQTLSWFAMDDGKTYGYRITPIRRKIMTAERYMRKLHL